VIGNAAESQLKRTESHAVHHETHRFASHGNDQGRIETAIEVQIREIKKAKNCQILTSIMLTASESRKTATDKMVAVVASTPLSMSSIGINAKAKLVDIKGKIGTFFVTSAVNG
jgi:hypothetical protein